MTRRYIDMFMWGYQEHYVIRLKSLARDVLRLIGADEEADVFLVGVRRPGAGPGHLVCVEPEAGRWPPTLFAGLEADVEAAIPQHELSRMFFGDEPSMRDKPEWTRQAVITEQVLARLAAWDVERRTSSLAITPGVVGDYHVCVVLQVPSGTLESQPQLTGANYRGEPFEFSYIRGCLLEVLEAGRSELIRPEPGRSFRDDMRGASEIVLRAARTFGLHVARTVDERYIGQSLFDQLNEISALRYEGDEGVGRMAFVGPTSLGTDVVLKLDKPVPLYEARWARKLLQLATTAQPLVATPERILGLGRSPEGALAVDFHGHQDWELRLGDRLLLRTRLGQPKLPQEPLPEARFKDNVARLFPGTTPEDHERLWQIMRLQTRLPHGSLVVIAADAEAEAARLAQQATRVEPVLVTEALLTRATRIDGAVLLDPSGVCVAIGVVLDGPAHDDCLPARGGRYNSAVRYVHAADARRLAIVYSDDRTLDVVPLLRPRVSRAQLTAALAALSTATLDDYHEPRNFLDAHRFYLDAAQCDAVNQALKRIHATPLEAGGIRMQISPFLPHPEMDESYLC